MYQDHLTLYALWKKKEDIYERLFVFATNEDDGPQRANGVQGCILYGGPDEVVPKPTMYYRGHKVDYWTDIRTGELVDFPDETYIPLSQFVNYRNKKEMEIKQ